MKKNIFKIIASVMCTALCLTGISCANNNSGDNNTSSQLAVVEGEYLFKNGISEYSVLLPQNANYYETFAANELVSNLEKATGNSIPVVTGSGVKDASRVISLGHTTLWDENVGLTLTDKEVVNSGYYIKTVDTNIYISCPDRTNSSGVLYGVYDFLKDTIDYEFYTADEIHIQQTRNIPLYNYKGNVVNPTFEMRMLTKADLRDDTVSVMRYRFTYPSSAFGLIAWGHGQVSQYILPDAPCTCGLDGCGNGISYQKHHPDWFSNYGTKNMQLCWTGGEALEKVTANRFIEFFKAYPDAEYFMFGQEDNISYCDCDRCVQAMEDYAGNPAGLQVSFMNNVIERASKWLETEGNGRKVKYIIYAYYGTEVAPIKTTESGEIVPYSDKVDPVDDLYIFYTPIGANFAYSIDSPLNADVYKNLSEWSAIADGQLIMYLYDINFRQYLINFNNFGTAKSMYETCKELGVACMTTQAADSYTIGFQEMRSYVESALMWNLDQSYDDLVRKFMAAYYKDAAEYLYEFYEITRDRYTYYINAVNPEDGGIYGEVNNEVLWTQAVVEKMDAAFTKALASIEKYQTSDPDLYTLLKNRIKKEYLSPLYIKLTVVKADYDEDEIAQMRAEFKYYVNLFKLSEASEGSGFGDLLD